MRIGHGYDAHRFTAGRPLVLGGVKVPFEKGLAAHSDGDAVIHALCDALLGAAGLGDIGTQFPDNDEQFRNIDSRVLLRKVRSLVTEKGYTIRNVDITVLAERPKLAPFIPQMRENLATDLQTSTDTIGIKASTTEKMGFIGREEGMAAYAVVLIAADD